MTKTKLSNEHDIHAIIRDTALKYVGQKEIKGNMGFEDPEFDEKMDIVGHQPGEAWCDLFAELVYKEAYQQYDARQYELLDLLFSKSAVTTFNNFKRHSKFEFSKEPKIGALIAWQKYKGEKKHWTGHIGVVVDVDGTAVKTVEGNTNLEGSREGTHVLIKDRLVSYEIVPNGLNLLGFIHPLV